MEELSGKQEEPVRHNQDICRQHLILLSYQVVTTKLIIKKLELNTLLILFISNRASTSNINKAANHLI